MLKKIYLPKQNILFYTYAVLIDIAFFIYHLSGMFYAWILGAFMLGICLLMPTEKQISISFFLLISEDMLKLQGSQFSVLSYYCFASSLLFLAKNIKKLDGTYFVLGGLHFLCMLLSALVNATIANIVPFTRALLVGYMFFSAWKRKEYSFELAFKCFAYGVGIAIILGLVFCHMNGTLFNGLFGGVIGDRNYFGASVSFCVSLCTLYVLCSNQARAQYKIGAVIALCVFSVILSGSRTSAIAIIFPTMMFVYSLIYGRHFKRLLGGLFAVTLIVFLSINWFPDSLQALRNRFLADDFVDGNGRFEIWLFYIKEWLNSGAGVFLGNGSSNIMYNNGMFRSVAHNTLIECIYSCGILGSLTIYLLIVHVYKSICGSQKKRLLMFFPLLCLCFCYLGIDGLYGNKLTIMLILSFISIAEFSSGISERKPISAN